MWLVGEMDLVRGQRGIGLDARTGQIQEEPFGDLGNVKLGNYADCEFDFVDGVFVPASDRTKISSTGLFATNLPANSGKAWDMIRSGPVASQFSTTFGATDFNTDGHSMIGLHANAGTTFERTAIGSRPNRTQRRKSTICFSIMPLRGAVMSRSRLLPNHGT